MLSPPLPPFVLCHHCTLHPAMQPITPPLHDTHTPPFSLYGFTPSTPPATIYESYRHAFPPVLTYSPISHLPSFSVASTTR
ncbi:hypothetical protein BDZ94DRAFT_1269391 [Collybia nuda]|uniref:Uncharacterized protein n=1 Tax=Collybia nuda TaxID=64659 RepID=A0A9P6CE82_9AGAR|nr:hypothetical protein BDZ94DRAFT_1269391 [Collybia nuda]